MRVSRNGDEFIGDAETVQARREPLCLRQRHEFVLRIADEYGWVAAVELERGRSRRCLRALGQRGAAQVIPHELVQPLR